jgi:hypothetical protein
MANQNHDTKSITIYKKTYQLPVLEGASFDRLQNNIKQRQQIIKHQKRHKKSFFGIIKKSENITFEEKFHELERLVTDYNQLISFLTEHKAVYQRFFAQLTDDLRGIVKQQLQNAANQEKERLALIHGESDPELLAVLESQKQQILGNIWLFGKAFLLMVKKIELINDGIEKITSDQDTQRDLLTQMVGKLNKYKKVYDLQSKINQSGQIAGELAEAAVNLEQYLKPFIGSFQGLIDEVCQQDNSLSHTVTEVQSLVEDIMSSQTGSFMSARADDLSKNMLDFLVTNEQKKQRLVMAVEEAQMQGIDWSWQQIDIRDCEDLTTAIVALQSHIDGKLVSYQVFNPPQPPLVRGENLPQNINSVFNVELKSEKNVDYQKLQQLLSEGKWKEADEETRNKLLEAMGKSSWGDVYDKDLLKFPKTDLRTMDQLWYNASDGKFGFSVQKQIWIECGGTPGKYDYDIACKFGDRIGWRKGGNWLSYSNLTFNTNALHGHLPRRAWGRVGWGISFLSSRL